MGNPSDDFIVEPREVDVLCGRGGMSNHHPGNEWYRRLIRSNRPLYRACPKHTKLLVSKAIVQAVEQQGGRFLERNRQNGMWYKVPYKRSVDKTSQGLRERDRDDDNKGGDSKSGGSSSAAVNVPDSFSGKSRAGAGAVNLSDLADVAIAHATKTEGGLPPNMMSSAASRRSSSQQQQQRQQQQQSGRGGIVPSNSGMGRSGDNMMMGSAAAAGMMMNSNTSNSTNKRTSFRMDDMMMNNMNNNITSSKRQRIGGDSFTGNEDFAPLPPTMEVRQTSMFKLLSETQLFPGQTSWMMGGMNPMNPQQQQQRPSMSMPQQQQRNYGNDGGNTNANTNGNKRNDPNMDMYGAAAAPPPPPPSGGLFASVSGLFSSGGGGNSANQSPVPPGGGSSDVDAPPPLSRLTSQVSDWLTSFWPLPEKTKPKRPASNNRQHDRDGQQQLSPLFDSSGREATGPDNAAAAAATTTATTTNIGGSDGMPPLSAYPPRQLPPAIQHQLKIPSPMDLNAERPVITTLPPPGPDEMPHQQQELQQQGRNSGTGGASRKRKSANNLPDIPYDTSSSAAAAAAAAIMQQQNDVDGVSNLGANDDAPLPPVELEASVSTTIMKLASSPSKLFSGLTSFFDKGQTTAAAAAVGLEAQGGGEAAVPPPPGPPQQRRSSKSTGSLLDDYEESETEKRLRTLMMPATKTEM